ncbi:MAG: calcium/sodium antiporter [Hydrogenophaga sp.]|uniref:calcium/sodium antiporter n=1 Tax=Hydrogenophaga sp. TaxID=1904254 RepID=UPI0027178305|nr:calcium/sodium antiporter [Hydrogenophaga sp.]MDO9479650.1 calcium/sodium antiporter [Hydrogenophaga sp.]MDO9569569.1 calcium/sodium antiporter [Hydrogenophaga sp.]MDP1893328.1 calcium/sodium antiporter [Hydrogenophaga sp.]MDP2092827.1 calcium/sodium antiporter [Hydrogenophaga sp.]MDP2222065.1 calcium/sodium antiporter [Hydrogenophaga sp.]
MSNTLPLRTVTMLLPSLAILVGLALLVWSADRFVEGASSTASHYSVPPLLVGMLIVGFGTSAPEMVVSTLAASQGNPGLALGNAWGSNIVNIALILGVTALISPIIVHSMILRKELPILAAVTALSAYLVWDGQITRLDAWVLLAVFGVLVTWSIVEGMRGGGDALAVETATELKAHAMPLNRSLVWLVVGLLVLVASSRLLVWGAVSIAQSLGVSDLIIGLTVVAVGTSLPELASCVAAARKGEHDIALGNVLGSNLFNTLAVVGIAGAIAPINIEAASITRDLPVMAGLTLVLFVMGWGFRGRQGRINRWEAGALLAAYLAYTGWLLSTIAPAA